MSTDIRERDIEALEALKHHGSCKKAADALGIAKTTLWERARRAESRNDGGSFSGRTPAGYFIHQATPLYDANGEKLLEWVRYRIEDDGHMAMMQAIRDEFSDIRRVKPLPAPKTCNSDLLTVYPIVDHHTGLFAWAQETRDADFDLGIAIELLQGTMTQLVSTSPASQTAVIISMGDFVHSDTVLNKTIRSNNILDVDGRWSKVMRSSVRLLINCVDTALQVHQRVIVRMLPGNHDDMAAHTLAIALSCQYEHEPRVVVDLDPSLFWIYEWGTTMIGATHGHTCREQDVPGLMANLEKEMWGRTDYRYAYMGHLHHRKANEQNGVYVETFQTLSPKDAWAAGRYTANRSMTGITYHKARGEVERRMINVPRECYPS